MGKTMTIFNMPEVVLKQEKLLNKLQNIFSADETGIQLQQKRELKLCMFSLS
jgi:hypothetical protein